VGRFELAHGGTIFLDEIGDLPLELQPKLLRVLQDGRFERLGSPRPIDVDVRVIAATNRSLAEEVGKDRFRADLFYRLNVFPITLPALRERREDVPRLVQQLVPRLSRTLGRPIDHVPAPVIDMLSQYKWPGNIRELENVLQQAIILSAGTTLTLGDAWRPHTRDTSDSEKLVDVERRHITDILESAKWRIEGPRGAADRLGMNPSTLRSRMIKLGITRPR
jgi:formate hydrogenlyase transcriptional activator